MGATQPEGPGRLANCRNSSRLTVSAVLLSKGRAKRATLSPIHLVRGAGAVGDSKDNKEIWPGQNCGGKKNNNKANWIVSNSAQLDGRTKQHTQFGVSASNRSRDMAWTQSWRKKK